MTGLVVAICVLGAHVMGVIDTVAPVLGPIGTIITTADHVVADAVNVNNYVKHKRAAKKLDHSKKLSPK